MLSHVVQEAILDIDENYRSIAPRPSHALQVQFEIQSYTFSSLKVEQLKITGETYKPYKGVRGRAIGSIEWRW
jgi:AP-3 complex subunit mu